MTFKRNEKLSLFFFSLCTHSMSPCLHWNCTKEKETDRESLCVYVSVLCKLLRLYNILHGIYDIIEIALPYSTYADFFFVHTFASAYCVLHCSIQRTTKRKNAPDQAALVQYQYSNGIAVWLNDEGIRQKNSDLPLCW